MPERLIASLHDGDVRSEPPPAAGAPAVECLLRFTRVTHRAGYATGEVETTTQTIPSRLLAAAERR